MGQKLRQTAQEDAHASRITKSEYPSHLATAAAIVTNKAARRTNFWSPVLVAAVLATSFAQQATIGPDHDSLTGVRIGEARVPCAWPSFDGHVQLTHTLV